MACRRKVFRPIALTLISSRSASCRSCRSCSSPERAVEPSALHQTALSGKSTSWSTSVEAQRKHGCSKNRRKRGHAEATLLHSYCITAVVGGDNKHFPRTFHLGASIRFPVEWGRQGVCVPHICFLPLRISQHSLRASVEHRGDKERRMNADSAMVRWAENAR